MVNAVKYPHIQVQLAGTDGNAFAVLGQVHRSLRIGGVSEFELAAFYEQATSGDYDQLLATCMQWVQVS